MRRPVDPTPSASTTVPQQTATAVARVGVVLLVCLATCAAVPIDSADAAVDPRNDPTEWGDPAASDGETRRVSESASEDPGCGVAIEPSANPASRPRIVELYPNPPTHGNVGEYLVVESPANASGPLTIADGYSTATIPADRPAGRVAVSLDPNATEALTDYPVVPLQGHLRLAADGETLTLSTGTETVDRVTYVDAPDGERWYRSPGTTAPDDGTPAVAHRGEWWPQGRTCLSVSSFDVDQATGFVLPDSPDYVTDVLANANDRIQLAGYTITDENIQRTLLSALDRGVAVEVLVEESPVGGLPAATRPLLTDLEDAGATVRIIGGSGDRYAFHHPKYAVVDDRALVTTENWKPAGVGGKSSRGWGVVVPDADLAATLSTVFDADATGHDTAAWSERLPSLDFVTDEGSEFGDIESAPESFPETHEPARVDVDEVELLLAPDNAGDRLRELIEDADDSIRIVQVQVDGPDFRLLEAALEAARRGVEVDLLLDGSWYVAEANRALADRLEDAAAREDVPLDVRIADGGERFGKVHAKGMVIDDEITVLGSLNWNDNSLTANREVVLVLFGSEAATYYASVFDGDWREPAGWSIPVTLALAVLAGLAGAVLLGRRYVRFDDRPHRNGPARDDRQPTARPVTIDRAEPDGSERAADVTREHRAPEPDT